VAQKKQQQQWVGCGCLAFVILVIIGAIGNACSSSGTSTSQPLPPTTAVSTPSLGAAVTPSPTHTRRHRAAVAPSSTHTRPHHNQRHIASSKPAPAPRSTCHPLTNSGKCYEPGEFCRKADHGASGIAGNGEKIRCEDNNGWRWDPV
jgi:hypothetical protein